MFNLREALLKNINKLIGTLKNNEDLTNIIKKKLTKKELKVFTQIQTGTKLDTIAKNINSDKKRVEEIYKGCIKKINQEKIKKELIITS